MQIENRDPKARLRKWIMGTQLHYQQFVEDLAEKKAARFAEQYAKAKAQADTKRGKYSIIARPNPACQEDSDDDEVLDIYEADVRAWDRAMTNWTHAQKHGKLSTAGLDLEEALELSKQGYL